MTVVVVENRNVTGPISPDGRMGDLAVNPPRISRKRGLSEMKSSAKKNVTAGISFDPEHPVLGFIALDDWNFVTYLFSSRARPLVSLTKNKTKKTVTTHSPP